DDAPAAPAQDDERDHDRAAEQDDEDGQRRQPPAPDRGEPLLRLLEQPLVRAAGGRRVAVSLPRRPPAGGGLGGPARSVLLRPVDVVPLPVVLASVEVRHATIVTAAAAARPANLPGRDGAAQESNLPSLGLPDLTGFEDRLRHRPPPLRERA